MIIFDLDGTLWNTISKTRKATMHVVNMNDIQNECDIDAVENSMGHSFEEAAKMYFPNLDKEKREKYLKQIVEKSIEVITTEGGQIYDGVSETIKFLSKHFKLGIVTNNNDNYVRAFYKTSGLDEYFVDYIGTATYGISKSEAIKLMISRNNDFNSLYVGDIKKDMLAAKEANIGFVHARYGFGHDFEHYYFIDSISELPNLLERIRTK